MKRILFLCFFALTASLPAVDSDLIPKGYSVDRYEPLWKKSPFTLSSIKDEVVGGFADKFVLSGILKVGNSDYVAVYNKDTKERMFLSSKPGADGLLVEKIEPNEDLTKVVVTLKKGQEISTLKYDPELLKRPAPVAPMPVATVPGVVNNPVNQPPPSIKRTQPRRIIIPNQPIPAK